MVSGKSSPLKPSIVSRTERLKGRRRKWAISSSRYLTGNKLAGDCTRHLTIYEIWAHTRSLYRALLGVCAETSHGPACRRRVYPESPYHAQATENLHGEALAGAFRLPS